MAEMMYIAGGVFGRTPEDVDESFARGAAAAIVLGFEPIRADQVPPVEHAPHPCPPGRKGMEGHNEGCHFKADLSWLLMCKAALFTEGWTQSWGSRLELQVATACGLQVYIETSGGVVAWTR